MGCGGELLGAFRKGRGHPRSFHRRTQQSYALADCQAGESRVWEIRPEDDSHSQLPEKSGGVKAWFEDGTLRIAASRYDKFGADPKLILEQICQVTEAEGCQSFRAQVCLKGSRWSAGTHAARRQSSERCVQVLFGLRGLGCTRFVGALDLSKNDIDDEFLVELLNLLRATRSTLDALNLDENRITSSGAVGVLSELRSFVTELKLNNNAIDQVSLDEAKIRAEEQFYNTALKHKQDCTYKNIHKTRRQCRRIHPMLGKVPPLQWNFEGPGIHICSWFTPAPSESCSQSV